MKITKGGMFPGLLSTAADAGAIGGVAPQNSPNQGGGQALVSNGSNTAAWQSVIQGVTSNGSNALLGPYVNFAAGSNVSFAFSSNTLTINGQAGGGSGSAIAVLDQGVQLTAALTSLDFVGTGVTATNVGDAVTVTIPSTGIQLASITAASSAIAATEAVVVSASLPVGALVAGNSYRITGAGVGTTGVTPGTDTFRIRIGPTTLTGTIPTTVAALGIAVVTAQPFRFEAVITLRTGGGSGTIIGECVVEADNVATGRYAVLNSLSTTVASVAVDTTVTNLMELTFQSGNAGSSNIFHVAAIEQLTTGAGAVSATSSVNQLAADVAMASANTYYDGPSLSLNGTYVVYGTVTFDGNDSSTEFTAKLWNGTTVAASAMGLAFGGAAGRKYCSISLVGRVVTSGTETWKISAAGNGASVTMLKAAALNGAGDNASTLVALRIA